MLNSIQNKTDYLPKNPIPITFRFWTYLIANFLSLSCTIIVLYCFLRNRSLRRSLNNHIIIIILIVGLINELIDIPPRLYQYRFKTPLIQSEFYYLFGFYLNYGGHITHLLLFSWATIQRHILIFHHHCLLTRRRRFFLHYLPMIIIFIYSLIYYAVITFYPFCQTFFKFYLTGGYIIPCIYEYRPLALWELFIHQGLATLNIAIFSIALIVRVVQQKRHVHGIILWRKYRRMSIQLVTISILYIIFQFPSTIILFATRYSLSKVASISYMYYALYLRHYGIFLFPFACLASSPELQVALINSLQSRQQRYQTVRS